jgi:hypothetical protein
MNQSNRTAVRNAVLSALDRLRTAFPLQARLEAVDSETRRAYARVLGHWLRGSTPPPDLLDLDTRTSLTRLDAIVPDDSGIGCYPFSARATGISVQLPGGPVQAMCAIDALAVARLAATVVMVESTCLLCLSPLTIRVEANGSLDHDQAERARVIWSVDTGKHDTCSAGLCRHIRFLCKDCTPPADSQCYTLPQAAAIGNAFFAFQSALRPAGPIRD